MRNRTISRGEVLQLLDVWVETEHLRAIDRTFARFILEEEPHAPPVVAIAAAVTSRYAGMGNSCLELDGAALQREEGGPPSVLAKIPRKELLEALRYPRLTDPESSAPLALVEAPTPRLYLKRFYRYERRIAEGIRSRLAFPEECTAPTVRAVLDRLFGPVGTDPEKPQWPRVACALALRNRFSVITGGPGTGKTTTVIRLLAAMCLVFPGREKIRLAAPTGKAAARLQESLEQQLEAIPEEVRNLIPRKTTTLHRLLRVRGGRNRHGKYTASNPAPVDLVVVDEASMMDVEMTARLFDALPQEAHLVLLGDKDQLASVDAGAVLADLCARAEEVHYSRETVEWIKQTTGTGIPREFRDSDGTSLDGAITMLRESYRFSPTGGIGAPAEAVRRGDPASIPTMIPGEFDRIIAEHPGDSKFRDVLRSCTRPFNLLQEADFSVSREDPPRAELDRWARTILREYDRFRILAVVRDGPWGVAGINTAVRRELEDAGLVDSEHEWYAGRPVIVERNDYNLNVMNGDIGVALPLSTGLFVAFDQGAERGIHWVMPSRLRAIETAFAITVHKSQGSEFDRIALVLPDRDLPILTRELVYTAITRASTAVTLVEPRQDLLTIAAQRRVERTGGLSTMLHGQNE